MAETDLQLRAEALLKRYRESGRCPIVIEFAGLPKSGKTTVISQIHGFLKRCGFRTEIVVERASVCPIRDKKHSSFNIWTSCTALSHLLDKTQTPPREDDPEVLILDRGLFDSVLWLEFQKQLVRMRKADADKVEAFLQVDDWRRRISKVIVMKANPEHSMLREQGHLPVDGRGGSIMNLAVLQQMHRILDETVARLSSKFSISEFDTSDVRFNNKPKETCEAVASAVLDSIEFEINELILSVSKDRLFADGALNGYLNRDRASGLLETFRTDGEFERRDLVEADTSRVQALPVVLVRNRSGEILRLVRRERDSGNRLHRKAVIWAGGHVRREDGFDGSSAIVGGAVRELEEELRLMIEPQTLELKGAAYLSGDVRSSQHIALLYEWRAQTDDVAIALCRSEFFERQGNSLGEGDFVAVSKIAEDVQAGNADDWSKVIFEEYINKDWGAAA